MSFPSWISVKEGVLYADGIPLPEVADQFGTPCYVYSAARIAANVRRFREAFPGENVELHYAVKANPTGAILRLLAREGLGAEVVSGGELLRARRAGFPAERIVFTGVGKSPWELRLALDEGIEAIVVESLGELAALEGLARERGEPAPVALRLNPALSPKTHRHLATGKRGSKFGLDIPAAREALRGIAHSKHLRLIGLHVHLGSQLESPDPYLAAWDTLLEMWREAREAGLSPSLLDLGGGFGIPYAGEGGFPLEELGEELMRRVPPGVTVALEPGRALVGDAGILLARVLYSKEVHGHRYVVVDAGMNDLLRPALYGARHRIVPVYARGGNRTPADVVGPVCENADFLGRDVSLPPLEPGDLLAVLDTGAYGISMASWYNSRPRPPEVLIHRGRAYLVRRREEVEELWRGERIPPWLR